MTYCHAGHAATARTAPAPAPAAAPAPAPGPSSVSCYTALNVLEASSQYSTLLSLLDSTDLTSYFDSPTHFITVFAPTNAGIASTLNELGTTMAKLANSSVLTDVLEYHLLPSPVLVSNQHAVLDVATVCRLHGRPCLSYISAHAHALCMVCMLCMSWWCMLCHVLECRSCRVTPLSASLRPPTKSHPWSVS